MQLEIDYAIIDRDIMKLFYDNYPGVIIKRKANILQDG